uniref:Uncharacterized protein n=1 Tax=Talaromyces marneffei PM1 TaxID=1077442 RepID=A0A093VIY5_TALMA
MGSTGGQTKTVRWIKAAASISRMWLRESTSCSNHASSYSSRVAVRILVAGLKTAS